MTPVAGTSRASYLYMFLPAEAMVFFGHLNVYVQNLLYM